MGKIKQLQREIEKFHNDLGGQRTFPNALEDAENRQQKDREVKERLDGVKDVYYEVIDVCEKLRMEETMRAHGEGK